MSWWQSVAGVSTNSRKYNNNNTVMFLKCIMCVRYQGTWLIFILNLMVTIALWSRYSYSCFIDEETEALISEVISYSFTVIKRQGCHPNLGIWLWGLSGNYCLIHENVALALLRNSNAVPVLSTLLLIGFQGWLHVWGSHEYCSSMWRYWYEKSSSELIT